MDASSIPVYCGEDQVPNIYEATQDIYVADTCVDEELVKKSPYQSLNKSRLILDPLAPDYKDVFVKKGTVIAPDELLHMMRPSALKVPLKLREDFESDPLPDSNLLQAIQYYASAAKITPSSMDETALLALGSLVESWVDEELKACDQNLFMEPPGPVDMSKYAPPESEESDEEAFSEEDVQMGENGADGADSESDHQFAEESDVMSLELSESDTASEVEGGRGIKRRKVTSGKDKSGSNSAKDSSSSESKNSDSEDSDSDTDGSDSDSDSDSNSDGEDSKDSSKPGSGKELGKSAEKEKPASRMDIGASSSESHSESGGEEGASGAGSDNSDPELLQGYADASDNLSSD